MMRHNIRFSPFGLFAAAAMLLATACQRELLDEGMTDGGDYAVVKFTVQPESLPAATRAGEAAGEAGSAQNSPHISDGSKADLLVYAVYDEYGELLPEFGQANETTLELEGGNKITIGAGQNCVKVDSFPYGIELLVKRGVTYKVAFWAQSSMCDAYEIKDLSRVQVHYKEYKAPTESVDKETPNSVTPNNDELRDAFCKVETLKIEQKSQETRTVWLYRPLAQINVGTSGYDYETVVKDKAMRYKYSRMQVATAARYLNVVKDEIEIDDSFQNNTVFEFGYALLPAYTNYGENEVLSEDFDLADITDPRQEFLKVHLYTKDDYEKDLENEEENRSYMLREDGEFCKYAGMGDEGKKTETFKWLSMGYLLVNSQTVHNQEDPSHNTYDKGVLNSVRVWLATDKNGANEQEIIHISNVDVTRNWRTNIVGDILTADVNFSVVLEPAYAGDYNGLYENGEVEWSGPLNYDFETNSSDGGAWYDAENDEILISNVSGLLWLQQMVNGSLVYTRDNKGWENSVEQTGSNGKKHRDINGDGTDFIQYFDEKGIEHSFGDSDQPYYFSPIEDPTVVVDRKSAKGDYKTNDEYKKAYAVAQELKARILRATHQDTNIGYNPSANPPLTWPSNNNFHFVGTKDVGGKTILDPANVKLVADIDLSGIEWLGIGFDIRIGETFDLLGDNMYDIYIDPSNSNRKDGCFLESSSVKDTDKKKHRGFFGNFDGNGHTVSNLKTKRFSTEVHPDSWQKNGAGPYEAVQWFARGFFGQLGGTATVKNLTLRNVDIYGNHCVGGIAGAAVGVGATDYTRVSDKTINQKTREGKAINIENCVVDGGIIKNEPMFRGDVRKAGAENDRTFARGVNTGGIVGLYNANGSINGCQVKNLTINGYRITGGIVGAITTHYLVYVDTDGYASGQRFDASNGLSLIKDFHIFSNEIHNTTILSDHFKPFDIMKRETYEYNYTPAGTDNKIKYVVTWAYGYAWNKNYSSFCNRLVGGEDGLNYESLFSNPDIYGSDVLVIDYACDLYPTNTTTPKLRTTDIENATVELLPVLNNWFVDIVNVKSNLIGTPSAYKRYKTHPFNIYSMSSDSKVNLMWNLPNSYEIEWFDGRNGNPYSGAVGMRVGAVELKGVDKDGENEVRVLSVREVTGEKDCAMQISSCDRDQFAGGDKTGSKDKSDAWFTSAETSVSNMIVRGNPYAYTGICLSPNRCMSKITLSNVAIYDVYRTIALDKPEKQELEGSVWPNEIAPESVELKVNQQSNLRGYTVPGEGWKSVSYEDVVFEQGSRIPIRTIDPETEYTCKVEKTAEGTTFKNCTFKAPYIIDIDNDATVEFDGNITFEGDCTIRHDGKEDTIPSGKYKSIVIDPSGIQYEAAQ